MKVLFAASEMAPWVKTGGLGDVAGALPLALRAQGVDVRVLLPLYPALRAAFASSEAVVRIPAVGHMPAGSLHLATTADGLPLYLLECNALFDRPGNPYLGPDGRDLPDNALRFGMLAHAAALLATDASPLSWHPEVLHCHDWQTALAPAYLRYRLGLVSGHARTVLTVHNLAFQGLFGRDMLEPLGLPADCWHLHGVEYHGYLSFLKAGLQHADALTTVSPTYAREIQTAAEGMGLDGLLRYRAADLTGIINGIDTVQWDPATDVHLPVHFDHKRLKHKKAATQALRRELGLATECSGPLLGVVSRLTQQKGLDLLPPIADRLAALPVQLAVLGSGDQALEAAYAELGRQYPAQFSVQIGFDEGLAHRIEAGVDLFLMPSRFEPCGLNQLYSLRYGTPPIVRATGGLADTVIDAADAARGTGFVFTNASPEALLATIERACGLWRNSPQFHVLQQRGMRADYSWRQPAQAIAAIYQRLLH
ncbi:MAG: glycogen synthase GlgA [Rhodocyclaceae bacterium]|jgi:starch synthase|nr:glycogen synthase GlgA [Rhodocyclaceae bacterium]